MGREVRVIVKITSSFLYLYGKNIVKYRDIIQKVIGSSYQLMSGPYNRGANVKTDKILFFPGSSMTYEIRSGKDFLRIAEEFIKNEIDKKIRILIEKYHVPITRYSVPNVMWNGMIQRYWIPLVEIIENVFAEFFNNKKMTYDEIYDVVLDTMRTVNGEKVFEEYEEEIRVACEVIAREMEEILMNITYKILKTYFKTKRREKIPDEIKEFLLSNPDVRLLYVIYTKDRRMMRKLIRDYSEDIAMLYPLMKKKEVSNILEKIINHMIDEIHDAKNNLLLLQKIRSVLHQKSKKIYLDEKSKKCLIQLLEYLENGGIEKHNLIEAYLHKRLDKLVYEILGDECRGYEVFSSIYSVILYAIDKMRPFQRVVFSIYSDKTIDSIKRTLNEVIDGVTRMDAYKFIETVKNRFGDRIVYSEKPSVKATEFPGITVKIKPNEEERRKKTDYTTMIIFTSRKFSITNIHESTADIVYEIIEIMDEMYDTRHENPLDEIIYI